MNISKDITIYDIAKVLNLSPATVSRGLKDHPGIRKDTKKKILTTAQKMGYQQNTFASNLRKQRTNTIGVIVPRLNSYFIANVMAGMEKVANEAGYNLIISQSLESYKKEISNVKTMFKSRVDGLMAALAYDTEDISHFASFIQKGIPVIFFDRVFEDKHCSSVVIDNYQAAYDVTTHLISRGSRSIVHITGNLKRNVYADRFRGFQKALSDSGIEFRNDHLIVNDLSEAAGIQAGRQLLELDPMPTGVFVANDVCAAHCMRTLIEAGVSIPEDVAFAGFNNDPITRIIEPNLTTVNYPSYDIGVIASQTMIGFLNAKSKIRSANRVVLRADLVVRGSSLKSAP